MRKGIELDIDIIKALNWLSSVIEEPKHFLKRMEDAQKKYIEETSKKNNIGKKFDNKWYGDDVVAGFFSQAKSLTDNRRAFEISTASQIIPWVKQLGQNIDLLKNIPGADDRAKRMIINKTVYPDTALFELILAGNYAAIGYDVEFIPEKKGVAKTPEFKCCVEGEDVFFVECKRLQKGQYAIQEEKAHDLRAHFAKLRVDLKRMTVWMDVTYKCEVQESPENYLVKHLSNYCGKEMHWDDEFGYGFIKPRSLNLVKNDIIKNGSLSLHTKLARLIKGAPLEDAYYNVFAYGRMDERDARFISKVSYATLLTWRCISDKSLEGRSRHVKSTLSEIEKQIAENGFGIGHIAMDVDVQRDVADKRRVKNIAVINEFNLQSMLLSLNIHYLVPRIDENHSWLVDETLDDFHSIRPADYTVPTVKIFPDGKIFENDLPGWHQK